jgi:hypothetical protein
VIGASMSCRVRRSVAATRLRRSLILQGVLPPPIAFNAVTNFPTRPLDDEYMRLHSEYTLLSALMKQ